MIHLEKTLSILINWTLKPFTEVDHIQGAQSKFDYFYTFDKFHPILLVK